MSASVVLSPIGGAGQQFFDNDGVPLAGGLLYSYAAGTTTPATTYTSFAGTTPNSNPMVLDAAGRVSSGGVWIVAGSSYKFVLKTSTGTTLGTWDNITGTGSSATSFWTNVQTYGAVGDGLTDDTAACAAAIAAAGVGGCVVFPPTSATYIISSLVANLAGQTLLGGGTIKHKAGVDGFTLSIQANNVTVRDLTFDGTAATPTSGAANDMIRIGANGAGFSNITIENVYINGSKGGGIAAYSSNKCRFKGNLIASVYTNGIFVGGLGADDNIIDNNIVDTTTTADGIFLTASPASTATTNYIYRNIVVGNLVKSAGDTGIESGIHTVETIIANNIVTGSHNPGILLRDCQDVLVDSNTVDMPSTAISDSISVVPQTEPATWSYRTVISNNVIRGAIIRAGIYLGGDEITARGNLIENTFIVPDANGTNLVGRGITIAASRSNLVIKSNRITNTLKALDCNFSAAAITLTNVTVEDNTVIGAGTALNVFQCTFVQSFIINNSLTKIAQAGTAVKASGGSGSSGSSNSYYRNNYVNVAGFTTPGSSGDAIPSTFITLLGLTEGGTNATLTAALGALPYSTASAFALLAPGTTGQVLTSVGAAAPVWSSQRNLVVPTVDNTAVGEVNGDFNCGYTSSTIGDLVYLDSASTWQKCDANTLLLYNGFLGIALEVKASGAAMLVLTQGYVYASAAFPTFTVGLPVYMSETPGAVTQTAPTTTDSATRVMGYAVHPDKMRFAPSSDYTTHV